MKFLYALLPAILILCMAVPAEVQSQSISLEAESGALWFSRNDVRIPNEGGTKFDMIGITGDDAVPYLRLRLNAAFGERQQHTFRLLFAPIRKIGTGVFDEPVFFEETQFEDGIGTDGTYRFNTYRLTYRYTFLDTERWTLGGGAALLVRDAKVELSQAGVTDSNTDLGFVPLVHLLAANHINERVSLVLDGETLAGRQGRATDVSLTANYRIGETWGIYGGYRLLEGGADVDEVYNFAWINFAAVGVFLNFR